VGELRLVAFGLIVVLVDFRVDGLDLATDIFGWILAWFGFVMLSKLHGGFQAGAVAAVVGGVAWAGDPWLGLDRDLAALAEGAAQTVIVFGSCTALMTLVPEKRGSADQIRWLDLGLGCLVLLFTVLVDGQEDSAAALVLVLLLIIPVFIVYIAFLVLLFRCAGLTPRPPVIRPAG
jgi:hypothetical protein